MKKKLYLLRHGQTMFNVQHKIQGWCDSPLTQLGLQQAKQAGLYFQENNISFDHAYCSTSERCSDTLELITHQPYQRLKGLKEMFYGELEGESERLNCQTPQECETYYLQFHGESSLTVRERMLKTLTDIMEKEDHQSVLTVSHGGACYNFLRAIDIPEEDVSTHIPPCSIFEFDYENHQFTLVRIIKQEVG